MNKTQGLTFWLTINHACNLRCTWCYQKQFSGNGKSMSEGLITELITLLSGLSGKSVILIGGEPTIHPLFLRSVKMIRDKKLIPKVISNSLRFSDMNFVEKSEKAGLDMVISSVKGFSEDDYERATGVRAFKTVKKAIENIENSSMKHRISITITPATILAWKKVIAFVKSCKTRDFCFSFEKPCLVGNEVTFQDGMLPHKIAECIETLIYPTLIETGIPFKIDLMFPHCQLSESFVDKLESEGRAFSGCHFLMRNSVIFDPDGQILPCNHFITQPIGKYRVDFETPEEYLNWHRNYATSRNFIVSSSAPCERCGNCERWKKCGAGCRLFWLFQGEKALLPLFVSSGEK